jgi:hypothetical protein
MEKFIGVFWKNWNACFTQNETLAEKRCSGFFKMPPKIYGEKLCQVPCPPITLKKMLEPVFTGRQ